MGTLKGSLFGPRVASLPLYEPDRNPPGKQAPGGVLDWETNSQVQHSGLGFRTYDLPGGWSKPLFG